MNAVDIGYEISPHGGRLSCDYEKGLYQTNLVLDKDLLMPEPVFQALATFNKQRRQVPKSNRKATPQIYQGSTYFPIINKHLPSPPTF